MSKSPTNPKVDAYFSHAKAWREEMGKLRAIALGCGLTEELKWGKPCYTYAGSNVVVIIPFKETCALMLGKGVLLKDPKGILIQPTENSQAARQIRFTSAAEIARQEAVLKAYLQEAIAVEKSGAKVTYKTTEEFAMPEELRKRLDADAAVRAAFQALTPGRQRGYLLYFAGAKQAKTREARIEKCVPLILMGKGLND